MHIFDRSYQSHVVAVEIECISFDKKSSQSHVVSHVFGIEHIVAFHDTSLLREHMCGNIQETAKQYKESAQL